MTDRTIKETGFFGKGGETLPVWAWLGLPVLFIIAQIGVELFMPREYLEPMHTEGGPIEIIQFIIMALATVLGAVLTIRIKDKWLRLWLLAATLGCFYIAGEEVSWGQWIYGWTTPDFWAHVNDQNETNFHNTSAWLDQKPRALLFIGIILAGLVAPVLRRWKSGLIPASLAVLLPSGVLSVTALGVLLPYLAQETAKHFLGLVLFWRVSEVQEVYMYYFLLLYLLDFRKRVFSKE